MIAAGLALLSGAWGRIAIALAVIGLLLGSYLIIKQSGRDAERAAVATQEQRNVDAAHRARGSVDGLGDRAISDRLRQFQRQ